MTRKKKKEKSVENNWRGEKKKEIVASYAAMSQLV